MPNSHLEVLVRFLLEIFWMTLFMKSLAEIHLYGLVQEYLASKGNLS